LFSGVLMLRFGSYVSKWKQSMATEARICPVCGGKIVDELFRRGAKDWLMGLLKCNPYRCRRCYGRFYVRDAAAKKS
jgi:hypothetical protein